MTRLRGYGLSFIPEVVDQGFDDERPYYVIPWFSGGSLDHAIEANKFTEDQAEGLDLLSTVAEPLSRIHSHGVAHRDIKPGNISLSESGPVIADFGLCLDVREEERLRLKSGSEVVGSRYYLAPENESGMNEAVDQPPADLYAFGKLVWATLVDSPRLARAHA